MSIEIGYLAWSIILGLVHILAARGTKVNLTRNFAGHESYQPVDIFLYR